MIELIPVDFLTEIQEQRDQYLHELPYSEALIQKKMYGHASIIKLKSI